MNRKYGVWATAACAALALGVTGCGGDDDKSGDKASGGNGIETLSAQQIADKAKKELKSATSVHVKIDGQLTGQKMNADLTMDREGNCRSSMTFTTAGSYQLVKRGDQIWLKPQGGLMNSLFGPKGATASQGKYIHGTTADEKLKSMVQGCDLKEAMKDTSDSKDRKWVKGESAEVDGQKVITLKGTSKDDNPTTLYIATEGKPYVLKAVEEGKEPATILYSDYDKPVPAETPSAAESIDIATFQQAAGVKS